jgi:tRNA pseudouridine55 synthase
MKKVVILNKKEGETPLARLESFRMKNKQYKEVSMTYAGRLDPMASGVLIILAGEECKNKEKYLKLDKEYEFEVLFGFATDTYDILGKVTHSNILTNDSIKNLEVDIKNNIKFFTGKFTQTYPMYSSQTVKGKHLFEYARAGEEVEAPIHEVEVKSLKLLKLSKKCGDVLFKSFEKRIDSVVGDFRQKEILKIWQKEFEGSQAKYVVASFRIKCGSGTYVRSIANDLGKRLGIPALALSIKRTKIGKYDKV